VKSARRFSSGKMNDPLYPNQLAEVLELKDVRFGTKLRLGAVHQAHILLRSVRNFCQSADEALGDAHVPQYGRLLGAGKEVLAEVRAWSVANSKAIWSRMIDHRDRLPLGHDGYLKLWALGRPKLGYQYVLLDEAQDTNPVVLGVHGHPSAQIVYVGDKLLLATHFRNQTAHRAVRLGLDGRRSSLWLTKGMDAAPTSPLVARHVWRASDGGSGGMASANALSQL